MTAKPEQAEQLLQGTGYDLDDLVFCYDPYSDKPVNYHATYYCSRTNEQLHDVWPPNEHPLLDLIDLQTLPKNPPQSDATGWVRLTFRSVLAENENHTVVEIPEQSWE